MSRRGSMQFQRSDSLVGSPAKPYLRGCSRLEAEFEELESVGSGGFGDVVKVSRPFCFVLFLPVRSHFLIIFPIRSKLYVYVFVCVC